MLGMVSPATIQVSALNALLAEFFPLATSAFCIVDFSTRDNATGGTGGVLVALAMGILLLVALGFSFHGMTKGHDEL